MQAIRLQKKYPEVSQEEMFDLINRFKYVTILSPPPDPQFLTFSAIDTNDPGRVDKSEVLRVLQASGEKYDLARETLKHVSVDASGKVELEDWVEVRDIPAIYRASCNTSSAQRQNALQLSTRWIVHESGQGHRSGVKRQCQPHPQ